MSCRDTDDYHPLNGPRAPQSTQLEAAAGGMERTPAAHKEGCGMSETKQAGEHLLPERDGAEVFQSLLDRPLSYKALTTEERRWLTTGPCRGLTENEIAIFIRVCNRTGLDPFAKQIHAMKRSMKEGDRWVEKLSIQTGIDGYRLIAQRTGEYEGQTKAEWCGQDGVWKDVWLSKDPPAAARVGTFRRGFREPIYGVALYREYVQTKKDGSPNSMWERMPSGQLAKCSEALSLRKGFPQEMQGVLTNEEMGQADNPGHEPESRLPHTPARRRPVAPLSIPADPEAPLDIQVESPSPEETPAIPPGTPDPLGEDEHPPYAEGVIATIDERSGKKAVFWAVILDTGEEFLTFDTEVRDAASREWKHKGFVRIVFEQTIKGNRKIVELIPAPAPAGATA